MQNDKVLPFEESNKNIKFKDIKLLARPITENHKLGINALQKCRNAIFEGCAGTGKTFISLNVALQLVLKGTEFDGIVIIRSIVPVRSIGFLKGTVEEKCSVYETPYANICAEIFGCSQLVYEKLKKQGVIDFQSTSFNQGITLSRKIIIVDEAQNLNYPELYNAFTRMGQDTMIIFAGDYKKQDMLTSRSDNSGLKKLIDVINSSEKLKKQFAHIQYTPEDIVRHPIVRDFIEADFNFIEEKPLKKK